MSNVVLEDRLQLSRQYDQIRAFCERWHIVELAVFGSVLREDFTDQSDIDVLITLDSSVTLTLPLYLDMEEDLQRTLGRSVDMLLKDSIERDNNKLRQRAILDSAQVLYAA